MNNVKQFLYSYKLECKVHRNIKKDICRAKVKFGDGANLFKSRCYYLVWTSQVSNALDSFKDYLSDSVTFTHKVLLKEKRDHFCHSPSEQGMDC